MNKKLGSLIKKAASVFMALSIVACSSPNATKMATKEAGAKDSHYPVKIQNYDSKKNKIELTFKEAPKKVVAVYQSSIETLLALGLGDRIVLAGALDTEVKDNLKDDFSKVKKYQAKSPTKEEVLGAEPDFIFSWGSYFGEKTLGDVKWWHERNINTYMQQNAGVVRPNSLENEYTDILNMGKIFNVEDKAQKIVSDMKKDIEKAQNYAKTKEKVKAVILEVEKEGQYRIYGYDSIGGDIAKQTGAELVADKNGRVGKEDLIKLNPDVIFTVYFGKKDKDSQLKQITDDNALASIKALKEKRVYPIILGEVYATGIRTSDGIKTISKGLYPGLD